MKLFPLACRVALALPLATLLGGCNAWGGSISNLNAIPLQEGSNLLPHFAPDGRQGPVVEGRQPGGAPLVMAMLPRSEGVRGWDVVTVEQGSGMASPTVDGRGRSVVFARGKIGGIPVTLLFLAGPDATDAEPLGSPRRMVIETLRLRTTETGASFEQVSRQVTRRRFCDGDEALERTYRMGLDVADGTALRCAPTS